MSDVEITATVDQNITSIHQLIAVMNALEGVEYDNHEWKSEVKK